MDAGGRVVEGKLVDSFKQELLAQQLDGRIVEGEPELMDSFEQLFVVEAFEQQALPIALVEQPSFLVNSAVWVPDNRDCFSVTISV